MKQESFAMSMLLDYYGALLTQKQKTYFDLYYNGDLSLAEIAEQEGISRQGVHDAISRAETLLLETEHSLGCVKRAQELRRILSSLECEAHRLLQNPDPVVRESAEVIVSLVRKGVSNGI